MCFNYVPEAPDFMQIALSIAWQIDSAIAAMLRTRDVQGPKAHQRADRPSLRCCQWRRCTSGICTKQRLQTQRRKDPR